MLTGLLYSRLTSDDMEEYRNIFVIGGSRCCIAGGGGTLECQNDSKVVRSKLGFDAEG